MSRIGNRKLTIPTDVTLGVLDQSVTIKGKKGELIVKLPRSVAVKLGDGFVETVCPKGVDEKIASPFLGLANSLINNGIQGVTTGFTKKLELVGVGYRAKKTDKGISMTLGFSHPVDFDAPVGITIDVEENTKVTVSGIDKQLVGLTSAKLRKIKKPEPYKGKGIRYLGEAVRRKPGKAGKVQK
ncbi:TPA: 50S ribosomal protein L6 [candidate division WWE3 bacterium]|uniref:Large ribosomal subunit protein uL6 n=5 Tax=Katanobacteria TaxID=422282 RepID=A0A0G1KMU2_UNCKA|nr:MAG: 50S ribosomal protein L6 [candidate division WWE3 bacterium GW2011_GWA2_44_16]KKT70155.1 MAG: 50S ribosomal protein L6 [candidate division WWE3 bacterium GW2011_GWB1_44_4]KKT85011.1 MAG: 50S ribosomal protein L6 [candidate division WWE3 bacterium GW2011_GWC2_44_9]OGC52244.1 MAG: 50S ribosomal protein L6 [candidate division WWE3 bacterium RIFCSPHIGHO2_01_FULL_43_9]HAZ29304.1 50S ribosomal protein L6 [candidate division WWE3 bacterium]